MEPFPLATSSGARYLMPRNGPVLLMAISRFHSSSESSSMGLTMRMPALLKNTFSLPQLSRTAWATRFQFSSSVTSSFSAVARPPPALISALTCCRPSSLMSHKNTCAPSRAKVMAVCRPMPLAAPVTRAILPSSLMGSTSCDRNFRLPRVVFFIIARSFAFVKPHFLASAGSMFYNGGISGGVVGNERYEMAGHAAVPAGVEL